MTRSLILHLGDHKTGSTSIQAALAGQHFKSPKCKILFPMLQKGRGQHNDVVRTLIRPKLAEQRIQKFTALGRRIRQADADVAVLSAENFEYVKPKVLRKTLEETMPDLLEGARLLVYVRPHADRLISSYAERIKQGLFMGSLSEFFEETKAAGEFFYADRLKRWANVFPGQLTVRPMLRGTLHNGDVVEDFFQFALQGKPFALNQRPVTNEKLCIEDLSILLELQKQVHHINGAASAPREPVRSLGWRVGRMLAASREGTGTPLGLDADLAAQVQACYGEDARAMDDMFFDGTPLSDRLGAAVQQATSEARLVGIDHHFEPETAALIRAWLELITRLYEVDPEGWRPYFQKAPLITHNADKI